MPPYRFDAEDECDKDDVIETSTSDLTDEEKLEKYKQHLEDDLDKRLKEIEYQEKENAIKKEFEEKNKEKLKRVREHRRLSRTKLVDEDAKSKRVFLSKEEIEALKKRYKELEARQIEILDNCTSEDFLLVERANGQVNALVDEYSAIEKLKLVLVDRIESNIQKRELDLLCTNFENSQLTFKHSLNCD